MKNTIAALTKVAAAAPSTWQDIAYPQARYDYAMNNMASPTQRPAAPAAPAAAPAAAPVAKAPAAPVKNPAVEDAWQKILNPPGAQAAGTINPASAPLPPVAGATAAVGKKTAAMLGRVAKALGDAVSPKPKWPAPKAMTYTDQLRPVKGETTPAAKAIDSASQPINYGTADDPAMQQVVPTHIVKDSIVPIAGQRYFVDGVKAGLTRGGLVGAAAGVGGTRAAEALLAPSADASKPRLQSEPMTASREPTPPSTRQLLSQLLTTLFRRGGSGE